MCKRLVPIAMRSLSQTDFPLQAAAAAADQLDLEGHAAEFERSVALPEPSRKSSYRGMHTEAMHTGCHALDRCLQKLCCHHGCVA